MVGKNLEMLEMLLKVHIGSCDGKASEISALLNIFMHALEALIAMTIITQLIHNKDFNVKESYEMLSVLQKDIADGIKHKVGVITKSENMINPFDEKEVHLNG